MQDGVDVEPIHTMEEGSFTLSQQNLQSSPILGIGSGRVWTEIVQSLVMGKMERAGP